MAQVNCPENIGGRLSKRLLAAAGLVKPCRVLADIGTDHAYLPIYLVQQGIADHAIAMDLRRGPLEHAEKNIAELCGTREKITTRLSDGLKELKEGEADAIVIAGMGGALTVRIIAESMQTARAARELILQPQSEVPAVRAFLWDNGWVIEEENMVLEDGKYYPMMRVCRDSGGAGVQRMEAGECGLKYGPLLLRQRHPVLYSYLQYEHETKRQILLQLKGADGEKARLRMQEISHALNVNAKAYGCFEADSDHAVAGEQEGDDAGIKREHSADH